MPATPQILGPDGKPWRRERQEQRRAPSRPKSRYDAAQTTDENRRHWANADGLSARAANDPGVRSRLRNRARYEFNNNGYCQGLVLTLADDVIGTGPTLQMLSPDQPANRFVEAEFSAWCEAVGLSPMLHTGKQAKTRDGEPFWLFTSNPDLKLRDGSPCPVQLDLLPIECDQFASPAQFSAKSMSWVDGVELDNRGRPAFYHLLKEHPGDTYLTAASWEADRVPAPQVIHWFRKDRPGQCRGVPEITPSLPLFAQLRRYTLATLTAAETAANFSVLLESDADPNSDVQPTADPFETIELERNLMTALPGGAKMKQLEAEQPTTTYPAFKHELLKEIGRPVSSPFNMTAGDSSLSNYSSARLDVILRRLSTRVERESCRQAVLERVFAEWMREALLIPSYIPQGITAATAHKWHWPGFESIDPLKEAKADTERLANGTATLAGLLAEQGTDWEPHLEQRGQEVKRMRELGLTQAQPTGLPAEEPEDGGDLDGGAPAARGNRVARYFRRQEARR